MTDTHKYEYAEISTLLDQTEEDWGDPKENRKLLVPYGIKPLDKALYGLNVVTGETILIMGQQKMRKTTFLLNIIINYMLRMDDPPVTSIDSLESGMPQSRVRDTMIANLATRYLLHKRHKYKEACPVCGTDKCKELGLSPEFLMFNTRSKTQAHAIEWAKERMYQWKKKLFIFDASPKRGNTRSLSKAIGERWLDLVENFGVQVLVSDHIQQYSFPSSGFITDYEKQVQSVAAASDIIAKYGVVAFLLSQVSLKSVRDARQGLGKVNASGGNKGAAEANVVFKVDYEQNSGEMLINLQESRKAGAFSIWQPLEDSSGAFYGEPYRKQ